MQEDVLFSAQGISKTFPGIKALKNVHFRLAPSEIHALIGENGAGKSTLMKIILGIYGADTGEMQLKGKPYHPSSPRDALNSGIAMIHQEISLVPTLSVSANVWIGREASFGNKAFLGIKQQDRATKRILDSLGLMIDPSTIVSKLSIAQMQLVEIARAISYNADIIIMDEPTSALNKIEVDHLFAIMRRLAHEGKTIVFISHKLDEVLHICERITVFRDGTYVDTLNAQETSATALIKLMVGRDMSAVYPKESVKIGEPIFEVRNLSKSGVCKNISFSVRSGETLGFAGLMGAGRTEIMRLIFGIDKRSEGDILLYGQKLNVNNTRDAVRNGLAMVTEDRLRTGLLHKLSVCTNMTLAYLHSVTNAGGFVKEKQEIKDAQGMVERLKIKISSLKGEAALLSGGNQQKVIIAKWLLTSPDLLILDEPTRGIDVGAKAEIYKLIGQLAAAGKAIIFISSELPEVMGISDRMLVISNGEIVAEFQRDEYDQERIMSSAFGVV